MNVINLIRNRTHNTNVLTSAVSTNENASPYE